MAKQIKTRRAAKEDIPAICSLWRAMMEKNIEVDPIFALEKDGQAKFADYLKEVLDNYYHAVFAATDDSEVVGYAIVAEMENPDVFALKRYGFICEISVEQNRQGSGIGSVLFSRCERWFKRRELNIVQLNVSPHNKSALKFYEKLGFRPFLEVLSLDLSER